ncbi:MAG: NTP transferase domain-containing protein [Candidatus Liptonbacteria bacterium]|nr:NTP transferase domain-containing protein [Candidatus Liptonbacteria bacterium]
MINVVLMAGRGQRFVEAGYKQSKPLIPVSGKPMILRAIRGMPESDIWTFVVRNEHLLEKELIKTLESAGKNVKILVDPDPKGQLNSCLVAKEYFNNDEPLFVGACDFGMVYDEENLKKILSDKSADLIVFSFTRQPNLSRNPQAWGWLRQDNENNIHGVSVKVPISADPFNDFAITGSFIFKSGKYFLELAHELVSRNVKVKGEFYIDSMIALACELRHRAISFPVKYIGWGTPADYEEYCFWEKNIKSGNLEIKNKDGYDFWHEYFKTQAKL